VTKPKQTSSAELLLFSFENFRGGESFGKLRPFTFQSKNYGLGFLEFFKEIQPIVFVIAVGKI